MSPMSLISPMSPMSPISPKSPMSLILPKKQNNKPKNNIINVIF